MKKATVLLISLLIVTLICATSCLAEASNAIAIYFLYSDNTEDPANPGVDAVTTATPYTELDFSDIAEMTNMLAARGMDTFAIVANEKYDANFDVMVSGAEEDIDNGRQFTFESLPDLSGYTDIYLGIPVWWATLPQQAKSFLQSPELDLSGKTIHFYSSHLGSRFGDMLEQIETLFPYATLADDPYTIRASDSIKDHEAEFVAWIDAQ